MSNICQYTENGELVNTFCNLESAEGFTGICKSLIKRCLETKCAICDKKTGTPYRFLYEDEPIKSKPVRKEKTICEYEYPSLKLVATYKNINVASGSLSNKSVTYAQIYRSVKTDGQHVCENGHIFVYSNVTPTLKDKTDIYSKKVICQIDSSGKIVAEYKNICQASKQTGIAYTSIYACIGKYQEMAGGYTWMRKIDMIETLNELL